MNATYTTMTQKDIDNAIIGLYRLADDDAVIKFVETLDQRNDSDFDGEAVLFKFAFGSAGEDPTEESSAIYFPSSDVVFTTTDWQSGDYPTSLSEAADYEWRCESGPGYILNGLPRTFGEGVGLVQEDFACRLAEARQEAGLTLKQLDELSGVNYATIAKIEAGKINPTIGTACKLLLAMGKALDIDDLYVPVAIGRFASYRQVMGERLRAFREERGIDILEVAAKGGISANQARAVERGDECSLDAFLGYVSGSGLYLYFSPKGDGESLDDMARKGVETDPDYHSDN